MRISLFDYGAGNLHSLAKALVAPGREIRLETNPRAALDTDVLVLPGVGAFAPAAARLAPARLEMRRAILDGLPTIGICLGLQLLFESSDEGPGTGLGVFDGRVTRIAATRVPHIGWNELEPALPINPRDTPLDCAYFANSFACRPTDPRVVRAWTTHERDRFPAVVQSGRCVGVQFHPEKSSAPGVRFLNAVLASILGADGIARSA